MRFVHHHLQTLLAVLDAGTLDAAAVQLGVTPSAVSQRLKALEQEFGRSLVVRTKPVRPTEAGSTLVRLARQVELLDAETRTALGTGDASRRSIPIAVNADSMATWLLPALARAAASGDLVFDLHLDDQDHTTAWLRSGTVMAAVTSHSRAVSGCSVAPLGRMTYRAVASPAFASRWFTDADRVGSLADAPMVQFDRKDDLQARLLRQLAGEHADPPRHFVPASADFARAVILGMGWGMLPDAQAARAVTDGTLVELFPPARIDVPLYWQQWKLSSTELDKVAAEIEAEASRTLD